MGPGQTQQDHAIFWLAMQLPMLIVCYVGLIVAVGRWKRHPTTSLLTVLGVGILILNAVIWIAIPDVSQDLFVVFMVGRHAALAVGVALILAAALKKRQQRPSLARYEDVFYPVPEELTRPTVDSGPDNAFRKENNP
jgi:predicted exporter